ncbi:MAG TPA: adenylate/guanylate cyclase domain-containing protein, partial [Spongiibacteraceae bacterium]|nr:adenylate/guanylate cyclase domain-containing protein [Spongiibacteraceae bacterium]
QRLIRDHIEEFGQLLGYQLAATATEPMFTDEHYELAALIKRYVQSPRVLGAAIFDHEGKVTVAAGFYPKLSALPEPGEARDALISELQSAPPVKNERRAIVIAEPITFRNAVAGKVALVLSRQALDNAQREIVRICVYVATALSIVICGVAIYLGRQLSRPIHTLVDAARLIERGEFTQIPSRRNDEFGFIINALNSMGQDLVRKAQVEDMLRRVLDRDVANKLLAEIEPVKVGGDRVEATVLFADIVGFTALSETMSPESVSEFLNDYFHYIDACARFCFGTIDKFIGDGVMVVFGASRPDAEHRYHAVACAVLMQRLIAEINLQRHAQLLPIARFRIGINSGDMLAGLIGSEKRMEYTVVGDAVNLASRLCAEALPGEVVIEENIYHQLAKKYAVDVTSPRQIKVRGKQDAITIYTVNAIEYSHPIVLEQMIDDLLQHRKAS